MDKPRLGIRLLDEHFNIIEFHGTFLQLHCIAFLFCCPTSAGNKNGASHMRKHSSWFSGDVGYPIHVCVLGSISKAMEANGCCSHQLLYPVPNSLQHQVHSSALGSQTCWSCSQCQPGPTKNPWDGEAAKATVGGFWGSGPINVLGCRMLIWNHPTSVVNNCEPFPY